ncbi:MAG: hypothetical protein U1F11_10750 [Steroidobacteraceae bacterium]
MNHQEREHELPASSGDAFARALLQGAARRAPPQLRERLEEEWSADMATRRGALARLWFALGCRWAARTIAVEFGVPARAVALRVAAATAGGPSVVPLRPSAPQGSPRFIFMVAIVGLHVAVALALIEAFIPPIGEKGPTTFDTTFIEQIEQPVEPPPAVPNATLVEPSKPTFVPPVVTIDTSADSGRIDLAGPAAAASHAAAGACGQARGRGPRRRLPQRRGLLSGALPAARQ